MPAIRSFYTLSVLAACLAQAWAGGYGGGSYGGSDAGSYGDSGMGGSGWSGGGNKWTSAAWTSPMAVKTVVNAQSCPPPATMTETATVTAVSPCSASVVTAYVTQWMNSPPGCWCGAGSPPPAAVSMWEMGLGMDNAAVFTSTNAAFTPGLSSIPVADAVKTGVTVAAAAVAPTPPAGAPPAAGSPGGFFTSGAASPSSGTETSGSSNVPSNVAEGTKTGEAESQAPATTTTSSATSSSTSSSPSSSTTSQTTTTTKTTSTSSKSSAPLPATEEAASASQSDFPVGAFSTLDPATLTLKNAYTLGIGKRAPFPTAL